MAKSLLIKDTTVAERAQIVREALGQEVVNEGGSFVDMYDDYIYGFNNLCTHYGKTMKLSIIGSRTCPPIDIMAYLKHLPTGGVSGGAKGADTYAREFAHKYNLPLQEFLPKYDQFPPKVAPLMRNKEIVEACDCLIAF